MTRARSGILILWLALLLASGAMIERTQFSTDMSAFLPRSPLPAQQILVDQLREGVVSRLILLGIEGALPDTLAALSKALAARLRQEEAFGIVGNGDEEALEKDRDFLWRNRYLLSPAVTPERFSPEGLHQALENDLQLLGSELAPLVKRSLPADPTGETFQLFGNLVGQARPAMRDAVWISRDGRRAVLMSQIRAAGFDIDAQERAIARIDADFAQAKAGISAAAGARLLESGPPVFAVRTRARMRGDAERFSLIATGLIALVLLLAYRSPRMLVLALLPVLTGALAGIAAVGLAFGFVHGITLGFGVTLVGEAVDYAIYLFTQTVPGSGPETTLPRIWPTLRLGMLTSICGFSAMLLSSFVGFAQLGLFTIAGLLVALGVTRWVLPVLLPRGFAARSATTFAAPLVALRGARRAPIVLVLLGLTGLAALALVLHRGPVWESEIESMSPLPLTEKALDRQLRSDIGAPDVRYLLVVDAPDQEHTLQASERLGALLTPLVSRGLLSGFDAPDRWLPSRAAQSARQAALPEPPMLAANLAEALIDTPFRAVSFSPFLADVTAARQLPLLDREDLSGTSLALRLDSLLTQRPGSWLAILPLRGVADPQALATEIAGFSEPHALFLDLKSESDRLLASYLHEALTLALAGSLAIVLLLLISLRAPRRVALVLAPLAAAVICTAAILLVANGQLSIFNLFGLLLVVAVGSNYSLFFERQQYADASGERMVASLVLADLCTVIGFGILAFSGIPVLHGIGLTVAIGAFLSLGFGAMLTNGAGGRAWRS